METKLGQWLTRVLDQKGWSHRELARRAKVSGGMVSGVISETRSPGLDFCVAISGPLGEKPETILRLAGLLPPLPELVNDEDRVLDIYRQLSPSERDTVSQMLHGLQGKQISRTESTDIILQSKTVESVLSVAPGPDDLDQVHRFLDSYRRHQVYDFALWQLRQQIVAYNSSGEESISDDWKEAIKIIDLLIATHKATPAARREIARLLEDAFESQQVDQADNGPAGLLSLLPVVNS